MERQSLIQEESVVTLVEQAQTTAHWMAEYLHGHTEAPQPVSRSTEQRLHDLFGYESSLANLSRLKLLFPQLPLEYQTTIGLYVAGYPDEAIETLGEVGLAEALDMARKIAASYLPERATRSHELGRKLAGAYIPLKIAVELLPSPVYIDDELSASRDLINTFDDARLRECVRQVAQYLSTPSMEIWLRISSQWLEGASVAELALTHDLEEVVISKELQRISSIFLKERVPTTVNRGVVAEDLDWQQDALCTQTDPEIFFPEKGGSTRDAKKVCAACDVRSQCLEAALENDERHGIWGGLSERERRRAHRSSP